MALYRKATGTVLANGLPVSSVDVYGWTTGGTTEIDLYSDSGGVNLLSQPIQTDSSGRYAFYTDVVANATFRIYLERAGYDFDSTNADLDGVSLPGAGSDEWSAYPATQDVDMASHKITSVTDPDDDQDAATKKFVVDTAVLDALFDANTILKADSDNTPAALTVAEQRLVGRITSGVITALTAAQVNTLLGTFLADGSVEMTGAFTQQPLSSDPGDPDAGNWVWWVSDGTDSFDAGDVCLKVNVSGTVKTFRLIDYSAH